MLLKYCWARIFYAKSIFLISKNRELRLHQADRNRLYEGFCTSLLIWIWLTNGNIWGRTEPEFCFHWKPGSGNIREEISLIFFRSNLDFKREFQEGFIAKKIPCWKYANHFGLKGFPHSVKKCRVRINLFLFVTWIFTCFLSSLRGNRITIITI